MNLNLVNRMTENFHKVLINSPNLQYNGNLYTGVDLGTSSIVMSVIDEDKNLICAERENAQAVKDGIVVDYVDAVNVVRRLKNNIEKKVKTNLSLSASAVVPGADKSTKEVVKNVLEASDLNVINIFEESEAAAICLGIKDGAVVDIGGGTTGISVLKNGKVISSYDEATGGHHMNLVLSGAYNIDYNEAEIKKIKNKNEVFPVIKPVAEKMATIVKDFIKEKDVNTVYLVGGSSDFDHMEKLFENIVGVEVVKPIYPIYITPLGISLGLWRDLHE